MRLNAVVAGARGLSAVWEQSSKHSKQGTSANARALSNYAIYCGYVLHVRALMLSHKARSGKLRWSTT